MKERIKKLRTYLELSQEQFAKKIERTKGYISNIENGHAGMSSSTISSICSAFAVNENWLRYGTGEMLLSINPEPDKQQEQDVRNAQKAQKVERVTKEGIGSRVREVRKRAGLKQTEFAQRLGCHKNQVSNVEIGKYIPSNRFLVSVAREFKVSVDWLRTGEADEKDPVDERLIEWLRKNPDIARELRIRGGLD